MFRHERKSERAPYPKCEEIITTACRSSLEKIESCERFVLGFHHRVLLMEYFALCYVTLGLCGLGEKLNLVEFLSRSEKQLNFQSVVKCSTEC